MFPGPDAPLCGIVLEPFDGVSVVAGELVVEVVVAFSESDQGGEDVVSWGVPVIERLVAEPMGQGVDAEGSLLDEEDSEDAGVDEATLPVAPSQTGNQHGEDEGHEGDAWDVVLVLPENDGIFVEIGDVGAADALGVLLHDHPADVRVEETFADGIRILVGVGVAVVSAMATGPPSDGALDGTGTDGGEIDLEGEGGGVGGMGPQTMVAGGDADSGVEVVEDGPESGLELQGSEPGPIASDHGDHEDEVDVQPVDMFPPIGPGDGELGDVRLLGDSLAAGL